MLHVLTLYNFFKFLVFFWWNTIRQWHHDDTTQEMGSLISTSWKDGCKLDKFRWHRNIIVSNVKFSLFKFHDYLWSWLLIRHRCINVSKFDFFTIFIVLYFGVAFCIGPYIRSVFLLCNINCMQVNVSRTIYGHPFQRLSNKKTIRYVIYYPLIEQNLSNIQPFFLIQ